MQEFDAFRRDVHQALQSTNQALREALPTANASGSPRIKAGSRNTCLSCHQAVKSSEDMARLIAPGHLPPGSPARQSMERAMTPESLPATPSLTHRRAISTADPLGALLVVCLPCWPGAVCDV